jgi:hypothetical protein
MSRLPNVRLGTQTSLTPTLTTVVDVGASGISRLLSFRDCAGRKEHEQAALPNIMR